MRSNLTLITPSVASILSPQRVPTLRTLITAGEPITKEIVEQWGDQVRLINLYGPSEAAIWSSCSIDVSIGSRQRFDNICSPLGCRYWVVSTSDHNKLVPVGSTGELLIDGPTVAQGYLHDHQQTAAAFVSSPAWVKDFEFLNRSDRFYKTGDIVFQTEDGSVVYKGRKDRQIKLRSLRIELQEIECHLRRICNPDWQLVVEPICSSSHPGVEPSLVAFFTTRESRKTASLINKYDVLPPLTNECNRIQQEATSVLPSYMIPNTFAHLKSLPLTPSGKMDRRKLHDLYNAPARDLLSDNHILHPLVSPTTETGTRSGALNDGEIIMQQLWTDVLHIPKDSIRATDDFFARGCNSIRAMRLVAAARRNGISITVKEVFEAPLLSDMASILLNIQSDHASLGSAKQDRPTRLHDIQSRLARLAQDTPYFRSSNVESVAETTDMQSFAVAAGQLPGKAYFNHFSIEFPGGIDMVRLRNACEQVRRRHGILRTVFVQHSTILYQIILRDVPDGFAIATNEIRHGSILPRFRTSGTEDLCYRLDLDIHHALYDAVSLSMVIHDLGAAYNGCALSEGTSFHERRSYVSSIDWSEGMIFWSDLLRGSSVTYLVPPTPNQPIRGYAIDSRKDIRMALPRLPGSVGTLSTLVKAAWARVLNQALGESDVIFAETSANRNLRFANIDQVDGPCLNLLPVRARVEPEMTLSSLVLQLQSQAINGIPYHHVGFREIIKKCTTWPPFTRFGSLIVFQNHESTVTSLRMGGLDCRLEGRAAMGDTPDLVIVATPGSEDLSVEIHYSLRIFNDKQIQWLCQHLLAILEDVHNRLDRSLGQQGKDHLRSVGPFPLAPTAIPALLPNNQSTAGATPSDRSRQIVQQAWEELEIGAGDEDQDKSMFAIKSDLVDAMLLSEHYGSCGYRVTTSHIVNHPTKRLQASMLDSVVDRTSNRLS